MFGYLAGNTTVWVIEYRSSYFLEFNNNTTIWTKKLSKAKTYQERKHALAQWTKSGERGTVVQHKLVDILTTKTK